MFGFFKSKTAENPHRKALREEFEVATNSLYHADLAVQTSVGTAINMAHSIFAKSYSSSRQFHQAPKREQLDYIDRFTTIEISLTKELEDPLASLGFGLFKMYLGAITESDGELAKQFSEELIRLSKLGQ